MHLRINEFQMPTHWLHGSLFCLLSLVSVAGLVAQESGSPVIFHGKTLFVLRADTPDLSASEAAAISSGRIERFAVNRSLDVSIVRVESNASGDAIRAGDALLVLVTDAEAAKQQRPRAELSAEWAAAVRGAVASQRAAFSVRFWMTLVLFLALYTILFVAAFWALRWLQYKARSLADWYTRRRLAERASRLLSLFSPATLLDAFATVISLVRWIVVLVLFNFYLNYSIRLFPGTDEISKTLGSYLLAPIYEIGKAAVSYLPSLFFVLLVALIANYLIRLNNYIFIKIARGAILVEGFYPDWAIPTAKLVRLLIIVLALIIAFPYLPGSHSPAFQGVSLFVGVLFSLGSSSTISNVINGVVLTYMRAFQVGDRVRIADTIGDITDKNLLVTRLQTIRNEIVTIPNSQIMASQILNYSLMARERRLILFTTVTIGYSEHWKRIHELLLSAAAQTPGVQPQPAPFVWQRALNDYTVSYELNVYTCDPRQMFDIYSALHANIQDSFHSAGVEIMSPAYTAIRDGNTIAIPESNRPSGSDQRGFRVNLERE